MRIVALVLIVSLLTGCSKAVVIPREELTRDEYRRVGSYRIKLHGWNEYHARQFTLTDSTLVIAELDKGDDRYKRTRHDMPIVVPLKDVEYVTTASGTDWFWTSAAILAVATIVGGFAWFVYALGHSGLGAD
jgi:hypothetical protein